MHEMQGTQVQSLGQEDALEKEMATHSSVLAGKIPRTEEPGGLWSMGSQRIRHDSPHADSPASAKSLVVFVSVDMAGIWPRTRRLMRPGRGS